MKERASVHLSSPLSVDALYSMYHFDLTDRKTRGELHDFYELVYVESGFYYVILDGEPYTVPPGSVIFFSPNTFHSGDGTTSVTATVRIVSFESTSDLMHRFDNRVFLLDENRQNMLLSAFNAAEGCIEHVKGGIAPREGVDGTDLGRVKLLFELFLLSLAKEAEAPKAESGRTALRKAEFRRISDYLKANLKRSLTLSVIASECSVSVSSLKEFCRIFCGCGPIDYLISLRIAHAKRLIREGSLNFSEIAAEAGFSSLHYFSRAFKARTGMSPSDYAKAP